MIERLERLTKILGDHRGLVEMLADAPFADALADLTTEGVARYLLDQPDSFFSEALARVAELWERGWKPFPLSRREVLADSRSGVVRDRWLALLEEAVKPCSKCRGCGEIFWDEDVTVQVTREMAMDAGDASLAGRTYTRQVERQDDCPVCHCTGYAMPEVVKALMGGGK